MTAKSKAMAAKSKAMAAKSKAMAAKSKAMAANLKWRPANTKQYPRKFGVTIQEHSANTSAELRICIFCYRAKSCHKALCI
jgi:hypothetical protein